MKKQSTADSRMAIVNHNELATLMAVCEVSKRPMLVRGEAGIGKSEGIVQFVNRRREMILSDEKLTAEIKSQIPKESPLLHKSDGEQVYGFIDCRLSQFDPTDIKGFPTLDKENGVSEWLPPSTFPFQSLVDRGKIPANGVLVFEELAGAPRSVQGGVFGLVLEREISGQKLAPGWTIVATSNSLEDMSVVNAMPAPLVSRFSHVMLKTSVSEWSDWAMRNDVNDKLVSYFRFKTDALFGFDPENWKQDTPYCCPRSVVMLSDSLRAWDQVRPGEPWPRHLIISHIGTEVGNEFYAYLGIFKDLPTVDEVVSNPLQAKLPTETSAIFAITAALAKKANKENLSAIYQYLERFERSFQIGAVKDINRCHPDLSNRPEFNEFAMRPENLEIFMALNSEYN